MQDMELTKNNMLKKLDWMQRSADRLKKELANPTEVQDHFLSFAHASHLLFFYFARWLKFNGRDGSAKPLIERYVNSLEPEAALIWKCLQEVRTEDVHVKPVKIANTQRPAALMFNGERIFFNEHPLMFGEYRYVVECAGNEIDVLHLCSLGVEVKQQFCNNFHRILMSALGAYRTLAFVSRRTQKCRETAVQPYAPQSATNSGEAEPKTPRLARDSFSGFASHLYQISFSNTRKPLILLG